MRKVGQGKQSMGARKFGIVLAACILLAACQTAPAPVAKGPPHNVVIFVADGLRYSSVNPADAPAFAAVRDEGVDFANSHSVYPTLTTVNASAIATGHKPGDTGNFANGLYPGDPWLEHAAYFRVIFLEDDAILADMNGRFGGNYLNETSFLNEARAHGYSVAAIGKTGPTKIQDLAPPTGAESIVIDEAFGTPGGVPAPGDIAQLIEAAKLAAAPPPRARPNTAQGEWFASVAADVLLPRFKQAGKPFVLLFWSPDPDSTQHSQTDGLDALTPGINGPTSRTAIAGASANLAKLRAALAAQGLAATTDVVVIADHGFSTISKQSQTSWAAKQTWRDSPAGQLPPGFLAIDLSHELGMGLFQTNGLDVALEQGLSPRGGSAMLGPDFEHPHVIVAANGATDLLYLPESDAPALARRIVAFLTTQDYVSGIYAADSLGDIPGALALSRIGLTGSALTPKPAIVVSFRSADSGCGTPDLCGVEVADTPLRQGQGMHGGLNRADTRNFMAAIGPDFKARFRNPAPVSNADIAPTLAHVLGFDMPAKGALRGRVIGEALTSGAAPAFAADTTRSSPAANGFQTILNLQRLGDVEYYDAAGAPGRAVGLVP